MIKIIQFGEGNFLRTFVDLYFDTLTKEGVDDYRVSIVKPITYGNLDKFVAQNNKYHVVLRGMVNGETVEDVYPVDCIENAIDPFKDFDKYIALAKDPDLKIVISNTTEAGIVFNAEDKFGDFEHSTFPAKVTMFLLERFNAGLHGLYFLPVELIENNADELLRCVNKYIDLWNLSDDFKKWNQIKNYYCNTLVDRIVSGYPRDEQTKQHLFDLIGEKDELVSIGEPFGLWVVQKKGNIADYIKQSRHNFDVILTDDIFYYKKRKVRVLNGSHTNLVPMALWLGKETVYDCMIDPELCQFVEDTLTYEINPFVSPDLGKTEQFANEVKDRFMNPFLNHQLTSIALNSISKWKARILPSFKDYYIQNGKIAKRMATGFAYLVNMYQRIYKDGDTYKVDLPSRTIEVKDDIEFLEYFNNHTLEEFMSYRDFWGNNLTHFTGFYEFVQQKLKEIK